MLSKEIWSLLAGMSHFCTMFCSAQEVVDHWGIRHANADMLFHMHTRLDASAYNFIPALTFMLHNVYIYGGKNKLNLV
jgi:hypothetical protein